MFHKLNLPIHIFIFQIVLENIQTTTLQEPSPFLSKADYITPVDGMESRISSMITQSSGKYIRHVLYLYKNLTMLLTYTSIRHN
jgi:hypothetical protein